MRSIEGFARGYRSKSIMTGVECVLLSEKVLSWLFREYCLSASSDGGGNWDWTLALAVLMADEEIQLSFSP